MTRLSTRVRQVFSAHKVVAECRTCGTTLEDDRTECPDGGSTTTGRDELV